MEMTRKEILNSSESWQERAETQCFIEHIDCTIQLVDKQQLIDKVCEWIKDNINYYLDWYDWGKCMVNKGELIDDLRKAMKGK